MRVKFNQAVHLGGKDYTRGTHEVPDEVCGHKFFLRLAEQGLVEDGENQPVQHQSFEHRQKALHEKIAHYQSKTAGKRPLTDNPAGMTDRNAPVDRSRSAEANPVTGKAQLAAVPGGGLTSENPAPAMPPAGSGESAPGQPPTNTAGLADANPPDGGTGSGGGPTGPNPDIQPGAEGFGPKDDGESAAEEESGPDSREEQPHRKHGKSRR